MQEIPHQSISTTCIHKATKYAHGMAYLGILQGFTIILPHINKWMLTYISDLLFTRMLIPDQTCITDMQSKHGSQPWAQTQQFQAILFIIRSWYQLPAPNTGKLMACHCQIKALLVLLKAFIDRFLWYFINIVYDIRICYFSSEKR